MSCSYGFLPGRKEPKWLNRQSQYHVHGDHTDRLPSRLYVRWFDICCLIASPIGVVLDVGSDIWVSVYYFRSNKFLFASLVLAFTILPGIVISLVSFLWYIEDWRQHDHTPCDPATVDKRSVKHWKIRLFLSAIQLMFIVRYIDALRYAWKFRRRPNDTCSVEIYSRMLEELRDASLLRLIEAFLESAPQLILQLCILGSSLIDRETISWHQIPSVFFSLCSLTWAIVAQHRCLRFIRQDKNNPTILGSLMQFLWRLLTLSSRLVAMVTFILCFRYWAGLLIAGRYLIMTVWLCIWQDVNVFADNHVIAKFFFKGVMGFLHILSPLNLIEGQTRYRYLWYYSFEGVENLFITLIPVLMMKNFLFPNKLWLLIYVVVSFSLGILCMILYYLFLHPNGTKCTQSEAKDLRVSKNINSTQENLNQPEISQDLPESKL